jgi:hypothetical protein
MALFDKSPFQFVSEKQANSYNPPLIHRKDGYYIVERYPNVYPWIAKDHQHYHNDLNRGKGVLKCTSCGCIHVHKLDWPSDAYYQWDIRGTLLWAVNREHAEYLLSYIHQKVRTGKHHYKSYKLPSTITNAKNRDLVVKKIRTTIGEI